jgi:cytoskeletal protein RodZ
MRRIIHKIRLQPPEFRVMVAVIAAFMVTAVIAVFWASTLSVGIFQQEKTDTTPSPISSLVSNIKGAINKTGSENDIKNQTENSVQVIDSGASVQSDFDESRPANSVTNTQ